jgi:hypothetical protein
VPVRAAEDGSRLLRPAEVRHSAVTTQAKKAKQKAIDDLSHQGGTMTPTGKRPLR